MSNTGYIDLQKAFGLKQKPNSTQNTEKDYLDNIQIDSVIRIEGPINTTVDTANADRHWIMTGNVKTAASACVIQVRAARGGSANNISIMAGASIIAHRIS